MGEFKGRSCDGCGAAVPMDEVTKKTVRFEGLTEGQKTFDLCSECVLGDEDSQGLGPIKRTRRYAVPEEGERLDTPSASAPREDARA